LAELHDHTVDIAQELLSDLVVSKAALLARSGCYDAAKRLLAPMINGSEDSPECLDLLARIRAQEGAFSEAQALWTKAATTSVDDRQFRRTLDRVAKAQRWPRYYRYGRTIVITSLMLFLIATATLGVWGLRRNGNPSTVTKDTVEVPLQQSSTSANGLAIDLEQSLRLEGVSTRTVGNEVVLTFGYGLFSRGVRLRPEAKATLKDLGKRLETYSNNISLHIAGMTDDLLPSAKQTDYNSTLALRRAVVVAEYLRHNSRLPAPMIAIEYISTAALPVQNETNVRRLMNRSATIRIVPNR